jgi:hypothetical protein
MARRPSKHVEISWEHGAKPVAGAPRRAASADSRQQEIGHLREWGRLLDEAFRIPGTGIRFGWDPILSLFPGVGEIATVLYSVVLLGQGFRMRVPKVVQLRMLFNVLIDVGISAVPVLGSAADVFWKSNVRNLRLLERYAQPGTAPGAQDWIFVLGILGVMFGILTIPIIAIAWLLWKFGFL